MTTDLARDMEQEQAAVMRALLDDLNELALINTQLTPLNARKAVLTERIKQGMGLQDLTELVDGETGVVGRIQDRAGTPLYDLVSAVKADDGDAVLEAGQAGMLRLDHTMLARFRRDSGSRWADVLAGYEMPGNGTTALTVEKNSRA